VNRLSNAQSDHVKYRGLSRGSKEKNHPMKKGRLSNMILILVFVLGLALLLYPTVSDYWNSMHQSKAIVEYVGQVAEMDQDSYSQLWEAARRYNDSLPSKEDRYFLTPDERAEYDSLLNVTGTGIMGYIEIPSIHCSLPIYHSTDESVLQTAIGHVEGTSLPVGGKGSHCVLSGHRALPSAKLFTDLDQLIEGDTFTLDVLDEVLTYEVDRILIVEPHEMEALEIDPEQDYCTLVTCTPYGINTHRLLVRGHRIASAQAGTVRVPADAMQIEPMLVAPMVAIPMLLVLLIILLIPKKSRKNVGGNTNEEI